MEGKGNSEQNLSKDLAHDPVYRWRNGESKENCGWWAEL